MHVIINNSELPVGRIYRENVMKVLEGRDKTLVTPYLPMHSMVLSGAGFSGQEHCNNRADRRFSALQAAKLTKASYIPHFQQYHYNW